MFCNYPVALPFYLIGAALLFFAVFPRYLEAVIKSKFVWLAGAAAFAVGMALLPSRNHLLGDGMLRLAEAGRTIKFTEPLDILVHRLVYLLVGSSLWSYRIIDFVAGLFYLNGIRLLVRLGTSPVEKAIIALAFLCTATIQFYFGYVESYGLLNLFILYYLYFGWKCVRERRLTVLPVVFFVMATLSHLSGVALLPSLVVLYKNKFRTVYRSAVVLAIPAVVGAIALGRHWKFAVTLIPDNYSSYSLFSVAHLRDLLCLLLLVSPAFYLALISKDRKKDKAVIFTVVALAGTFLFTLLFDPVLGAIRDWDIMSVFALPLAAVIALRAPRRAIVVGILAATIVARIVPWIVFNTQQQTEFVKRILNDDLHYSAQYANGDRLVSWGYLLRECGDLKGAAEALQKRVSYGSSLASTRALLGQMQYQLGEYPEAYQTYLRLMESQPANPEYRYRAAYLLFCMADYDSAWSMVSNSPPGFTDVAYVKRLSAGLLSATGQHQQAVDIIQKTPIENTEHYLAFVLAKSCLAVGRNDLARQLISRAIELDSTNQDYRKLADQISGSQ